jgi:hypothetical protein
MEDFPDVLRAAATAEGLTPDQRAEPERYPGRESPQGDARQAAHDTERFSPVSAPTRPPARRT